MPAKRLVFTESVSANLTAIEPFLEPEEEKAKGSDPLISTEIGAQESARHGACLPPVPKGGYEQYELLGIKNGLGGAPELQVQITYPWLKWRSVDRQSQTVPASRKARPEQLAVPSP